MRAPGSFARPARAGCWCASVAFLACDAGSEAPARSRVQAVLAEPGKEQVQPRPEPPRTPAKAPRPRPVLCEGQLQQKGVPFEPKRSPVRLSLGGPELEPDPLARAGGRWTWVNFWAAWCVPCKEELPLLLDWQASLAESVRFRFVSLDDDERQLRDHLGREGPGGLTSTYWLPDGGLRQAWLEALQLESEPELPLQLLIDPSGKLRCRVQGAVEPKDREALERIVRG